MRRHLTAVETGDGWLVAVAETHACRTREEVMTMARYLNLAPGELDIRPLPPNL